MTLAVIFSNTTWTFWNVFLLSFLFIPLIMLWFFAMIDVFRRRDLHGGGKALWLLAIVFLPWLGTLAYLITRPRESPEDVTAGYASMNQQEQMDSLDRLYRTGQISSQQYESLKARATENEQIPPTDTVSTSTTP